MKTLRDIRKAKGINQFQLADMVNVTQAAISQYESGERFPKRDTLIKLAKVLGCTVDDLIEGDTDDVS